MIRRTLGRLPIAAQLMLLLLVCLFATHVMFLAVVSLMPPPRPPIYRMSEIAGALQGGPLTARDGRPMLRTVSGAAPASEAEDRRHRRGPPLDAVLAATLGRPRADVRLALRRPSGLDRFFGPPTTTTGRIVLEHRGQRSRRDAPAGPPRDGPPPDRDVTIRMDETRTFHVGAMGGPGGPREMFGLRLMRDGPVFGDFTAALRQADGRWTIVRSSAEPFPTDWQKRIFLLAFAGFAVVGPAGFLFARRITAPLKRFSEAAERLGRDPHAEPVSLSGPAEIGAAAEAFNNMQGRLKRYIDDRTAMVGAISHDLRTPLARIRFKLEGAPEALKDSVVSDVAQMEQMIGGVLTFIRNESTPRRREKLDLLSLLECVVDDAALVGGDVEMAPSQPVTVDGDAAALQRLFVNLVDNAVKYGRQARISLRQEGDMAVVEVADAGEGLSPEDLERVFQPFYRADPARNVDAGGIGLGLPIARSTARAHGGDVDLASTPEGVVATVTLPAA